MTKKVALALYSFNISKISLVNLPEGPSSKVIYTTFLVSSTSSTAKALKLKLQEKTLVIIAKNKILFYL